jgi:hypothetical protein
MDGAATFLFAGGGGIVISGRTPISAVKVGRHAGSEPGA